MPDISKITGSNNTQYDIKDTKARGVELTQAQYDALVQAGTVDPEISYYITDAQKIMYNGVEYLGSDNKVEQIATDSTLNSNLSILFGKTNTASTVTEEVRKDSTLTYNPAGNTLSIKTSADQNTAPYLVLQTTSDAGQGALYGRETLSLAKTIDSNNLRVLSLENAQTKRGLVQNVKVDGTITTKDILTVDNDNQITSDCIVGEALTTVIPSVGNGTLTIAQNGTSKGTFTANQSGNATIALTDTTYSSLSAASGNTSVSLCTRGEKYTWNNKSNTLLVRSVSKTVTNGATNGWHTNNSLSCAYSGYTPLLAVENKFNGLSSAADIDMMGVGLSGTTLSFAYKSNRTDSGNLTFYFNVLYVKN